MKVVNLYKNNYSVGIRGMGYYIPENKVTNDDIAKNVDTSDEWITEKTGIKTRYICSDEQAVSDMAVEAAKKAIHNAGISPLDIDLIVMTTLQPDHPDPLTASLVQHKIGAKNAAAFNMSIGGCPDSVFSFVTAAQFILSGAYKTVLLVNSEANSKGMNWKDRNMCVFFGDGAGAMILQPVKKGKGMLGYTIKNDGAGYDVINIEAGGSRVPITEEAVKQGLHYPKMDGKKVFEFATKVFPESLLKVLGVLGIDKDELDLVISHQANVNIIKKGMERLQLPMEKTFVNIHKYGNMSSASVPVALIEAFEADRIKPEDYVSLTAFGAGLAWGTILMNWPCKSDFIQDMEGLC